jgi:hypothetical protein
MDELTWAWRKFNAMAVDNQRAADRAAMDIYDTTKFGFQ